jgi:choline dehydrogenase-like flavoprotein
VFVDARRLENGARIDADVCIIGGGAAGITIAREFLETGAQVCLLESGGFEFENATQTLYEGANVGLPYYDLRVLRLRFLGGTTNHWGGWCRPLDPIDFEARPGIPHSGWPFGIEHLDPFYRRAHVVCEAGPYDYDVENWISEEQPRLPLPEDKFITTAMRKSPPTRFGQVYREAIDRSANVKAYLHANVTEIVADETGRSITRARVATLEGGEFTVEAGRFILATGAIENARLLLASNGVRSAGLGNDHDHVGRYFMEHLMLPGAMLLLADPDRSMEFYYEPLAEDVRGVGFLRVAPQVLRDEQLLNTRILFMPGVAQELAMKDSDGVLSATMLFSALRSGRRPENLTSHVANVIKDLDKIAIYSYRRAFREAAAPISLQHQIEQSPNPDSRVKLGSDRDALGVPRVELDWRFGEPEQRTLRRVNEILAQQVGAAGIGRLRIVEDDEETGWPPGVRGAWHQMGTTRMSEDAGDGVVDPDCRVHGISNLFVAGSSVFPTSGTSNPTLTIVALALRLADHIKELLNGNGTR